jgi:nitroreductase
MTNINAVPIRKSADASYPIHDLIGERWSPRAFADLPVEREKLYSLLEAARWAASGGNLQPWYFIVATKENADDYERLLATLWDRNALWAKHAPMLILVVAKLSDRPGREYTTFYDVGMAAGNLVTQAVDLGLVTHQMGGFDPDKARASLGIPEDYQPLAVIALGYPGTPDILPDDLREREVAPRSRKPLEEFAFEGRWEQSVPAL